MCQKKRLCVNVQKLDDVIVADNTTATSLWERLGGDDLPVVVRVLMAVASDLLACRTIRTASTIRSYDGTYLDY